jgi:hypothetical protein
MPVCLAAVKIVAKATPAVPFSIGKARGSRNWIDATICELLRSHHPTSCGSRLMGILETVDTPGQR